MLGLTPGLTSAPERYLIKQNFKLHTLPHKSINPPSAARLDLVELVAEVVVRQRRLRGGVAALWHNGGQQPLQRQGRHVRQAGQRRQGKVELGLEFLMVGAATSEGCAASVWDGMLEPAASIGSKQPWRAPTASIQSLPPAAVRVSTYNIPRT